MASRDGSIARANDVRTHRRDASVEPARGKRFRSSAKGSSLGTAAVATSFVTRADKSEPARSTQQQSRWRQVLEKQSGPANGAVSYRASEPV